MKYRYATLDVFTRRRFAGNPLAVVFDSDALDTSTMQAIAREFGHPETVFVERREASASEARVRIFTPAMELPFAGHPTVGTAVVLVRNSGAAAARSIVLHEKIGPVRCRVNPTDGDGGHAEFEVPQLPQDIGGAAEPTLIAAALGIDADDIGIEGFAPARWSAGNPFNFVPLRSLAAVRRCKVDASKWDAAFEGRSAAYVYCRETVEQGNAFHARMFALRLGINEDPATGSAAAAFAGVYARGARLGDGDHRIRIEQGFEMGRPSLIELALTIRGGSLTAASVGGGAIIVTEGTIEA